MKAPSEQRQLKRRGLLKLPCPSRTAVRFLNSPRPGAHPFGAMRKTATFKSAVLRICVGAKKGMKKSPLPEFGRPVLADQESDQSSGGSSVGVWGEVQINTIDGRPVVIRVLRIEPPPLLCQLLSLAKKGWCIPLKSMWTVCSRQFVFFL